MRLFFFHINYSFVREIAMYEVIFFSYQISFSDYAIDFSL